MMKAIHAQEDRAEALKKAAFVVERLRQMKLKNEALLVAEGLEDTLSYYAFPPEHWRRIRTNNVDRAPESKCEKRWTPPH